MNFSPTPDTPFSFVLQHRARRLASRARPDVEIGSLSLGHPMRLFSDSCFTHQKSSMRAAHPLVFFALQSRMFFFPLSLSLSHTRTHTHTRTRTRTHTCAYTLTHMRTHTQKHTIIHLVSQRTPLQMQYQSHCGCLSCVGEFDVCVSNNVHRLWESDYLFASGTYCLCGACGCACVCLLNIILLCNNYYYYYYYYYNAHNYYIYLCGVWLGVWEVLFYKTLHFLDVVV